MCPPPTRCRWPLVKSGIHDLWKEGQFTLWTLEEESEKKPRTLLGWHTAFYQCKQIDGPLGSFDLFWSFIREKNSLPEIGN